MSEQDDELFKQMCEEDECMYNAENPMSGYESPIHIISEHVNMHYEGEILKAVQRLGIDVDKDKLIKALQYDREQYDKGYQQGRTDAIDEFVECAKEYGNAIDLMDIEDIATEMKGER